MESVLEVFPPAHDEYIDVGVLSMSVVYSFRMEIRAVHTADRVRLKDNLIADVISSIEIVAFVRVSLTVYRERSSGSYMELSVTPRA